MAIVWLVYILALFIFLIVGWTGVFHARKYHIPGDFTNKAATIYIIVMIAIVIITVSIVLINGANAPIRLPDIHINFR